MTPEEAEQIRQYGTNAIKQGGPGGCVTPEEYIKYCSEAEHFEECASFFGPGSMPQQEQHFPFQQERTRPIVELVLRFLLGFCRTYIGIVTPPPHTLNWNQMVLRYCVGVCFVDYFLL